MQASKTTDQPFLALVLTLCTAVCGTGCLSGKSAVGPVHPPLQVSEMGSMKNVSVSDGFWIGSLPSEADLDLAKRRGIERVIDLCTPDEHPDFNVAAVCSRLGIACVYLGLRDSQNIPERAVDRVIALLAGRDMKTLVFCGDGSRAPMFFAVHRVVNEGFSVDDAILEARRSGMRPGWCEDFVREQADRLLSVPQQS